VFFISLTSLLTDDSDVSIEKYGALHAMISSHLWARTKDPSLIQDIPVKDRAGKRLPSSFIVKK